MKETTISIIDALRGQQAQLKRLLAQKVWISDAPRPELSEIEAQVIEVKRLLAELEKNIQDQLQRGHAPRPEDEGKDPAAVAPGRNGGKARAEL